MGTEKYRDEPQYKTVTFVASEFNKAWKTGAYTKPPCEEQGLIEATLCGKCTHGLVTRQRGKLFVNTWCRQIKSYVPADIADCTGFSNKAVPDLSDLAHEAILLDLRQGYSDDAYL